MHKKKQSPTNQYTHVETMLKTLSAFEKTKTLKLNQKIPRVTALETELTTYKTNSFQTKKNPKLKHPHFCPQNEPPVFFLHLIRPIFFFFRFQQNLSFFQ